MIFDDRCSDGFRDDVEQLAEGAFTPLWTHGLFRRDSFAGHVAARSSTPYLITTRIDSDDAMAVDFMARVQAQFARQDRVFVNFPRGIQIDRTGAVYRTDIASSPFVSFIERRQPGRAPDTVFVAKHARARGHAPLLQVDAPVMWAQVVHDDNVSNIVNGLQSDPRIMSGRFDLDLRYDEGLGALALRRAQARQVAELGRLWVAHPGELTKWAEAAAWTARGTHLCPQNSGSNISDRLEVATHRQRTRWREARWALKERINGASSGVEVVGGDLASLLDSDRVVVLAEWSRGRDVRGDALAAAGAYAAAGWPTLIVAAREPWVRLRRRQVPAGVVVARRPNSAYDFGSWRDALATWPELAAKERVVLTNDSLVGPIGPLQPLMARIEGSTAQVWAPTMNHQPVAHLQSYLLAFSDGVLATRPLQEFFASVLPQPSKTEVVRSYEFGLSRLLDELGVRTEVGWSQGELGLPPEVDLPLDGWRVLLEAGFPFVKRTLLTHPRFAAGRAEVEARIREGRGQPASSGPRKNSP